MPDQCRDFRKQDYEVRSIGLTTARALVVAHHYAKGGSNTGVYFHGLIQRAQPHVACGVAWWLPPTRRAAESVDRVRWRQVLALTRLVVTPEVPLNGASFLLGRSIRMIRADGRFVALVTYADESQGHLGRSTAPATGSTSAGPDPIPAGSTRTVSRSPSSARQTAPTPPWRPWATGEPGTSTSINTSFGWITPLVPNSGHNVLLSPVTLL
jgi:hypothetical protein